jgi:hypothetical protein
MNRNQNYILAAVRTPIMVRELKIFLVIKIWCFENVEINNSIHKAMWRSDTVTGDSNIVNVYLDIHILVHTGNGMN